MQVACILYTIFKYRITSISTGWSRLVAGGYSLDLFCVSLDSVIYCAGLSPKAELAVLVLDPHIIKF